VFVDRLAAWRTGLLVSGVRRMNEVNPRRAGLVLGRVRVFVWVYHLGVAKSTTNFGWGKGGNVTSAGWQVTL